jgi:hypothetical protein
MASSMNLALLNADALRDEILWPCGRISECCNVRG